MVRKRNDPELRLSSVLGALVSGLGTARQDADLNTLRIAHLYRGDEFLRSISIPRMRYHRVLIDLPVVLGKIVSRQPAVLADPSESALETGKTLEAQLDRWSSVFTLANQTAFVDKFRVVMSERHRNALPQLATLVDAPDTTLAEIVASIAVQVLEEHLDRERPEGPPESYNEAREAIVSEVWAAAWGSAIQSRAQAAEFAVSAGTEEVKNSGARGLVANVKMTLLEEGLSWHRPDENTNSWKLIPE